MWSSACCWVYPLEGMEFLKCFSMWSQNGQEQNSTAFSTYTHTYIYIKWEREYLKSSRFWVTISYPNRGSHMLDTLIVHIQIPLRSIHISSSQDNKLHLSYFQVFWKIPAPHKTPCAPAPSGLLWFTPRPALGGCRWEMWHWKGTDLLKIMPAACARAWTSTQPARIEFTNGPPLPSDLPTQIVKIMFLLSPIKHTLSLLVPWTEILGPKRPVLIVRMHRLSSSY